MQSSKNFWERCTSLAIMGGTFDPIHNGHLAIAEAVLYQFKPQRVLLIPAGDPPHKPNKPITTGEHRYQMILQSICHIPGFDTTRMEIDRSGASYTVDTIKEIKNACPAGSTIYFILGQDAIENILTWKDARELLGLCQFVVAPRPGMYEIKKLQRFFDQLEESYNTTIHVLETPMLNISSTYIRDAFKRGCAMSSLMPREAEEYAYSHGLYGSFTPDYSNSHFEWAKSQLEKRLSPKRFKHTLGVIIEAEKLAKHYNADIECARWAGLLHDCTKEYSADKKRALCTKWGIKIDSVVEGHIDLAHGLLGAESAKRDFFVTDNKILQAIRFHILGHKNLTLLDKIICLADFIEPYREDYYPLQQMRDLAYVDIDKALSLGIMAMQKEDSARGKTLHHWSDDALKALNVKEHVK